jgi:hypothetical protein
MQAPFDNIVQHLFHQPSLQSVTVDELERMAQQHPYFAAAHFLLLKKMQQMAHPQFTAQLHKTTLYFNNPLWLQFLLQPETVKGFSVLDKSPFIAEEPAFTAAERQNGHEQPQSEVIYDDRETENVLPAGMPAPDPYVIEQIVHSSVEAAPAGMMDVITEVFQEAAPPHPYTEQGPATLPVTETAEIIHDNNTATEAVEEIMAASPEEELPLSNEPSAEAPPIPEETWLPDAVVTNVNEQVMNAGENTVTIFPEITEAASNPVEQPQAANEDGPHLQEEELTPAENHIEADATDAPVTESSSNEMPLLKTIIEMPAASSDTLFEPYHTVDYFASQGIKLSKMEAEPKDKLGRQLKSFTEWLKTMKKLPQVSIDKLLSENEESKVVADAIHSIENKEVITEAMAEVFEKQGMNVKAVEVYEKLSLLNPGKSTYFAAKIAILKH